ncbi:MAG TPA: hypothetical protein VI172_14910 [Candidatus Dormibacteraeota bacterium]|jgi:hypothetical protein
MTPPLHAFGHDYTRPSDDTATTATPQHHRLPLTYLVRDWTGIHQLDPDTNTVLEENQ